MKKRKYRAQEAACAKKKTVTLVDEQEENTTNPIWVVVLIVIAHLAWSALLTASFIEKVVMAGIDDVLEHFTNWSLAFQIFFYWITLFLLIDENLFQKALLCFFFPLHGVVWIVFILINIILNINPDVLEQYFKKFSIGFVLSANEFLHSVPVMIVLMFAFYHRSSLISVLRYYYLVVADNFDKKLFLFLYQSFGSLIYLGLYDAIYNPNDVYEVEDDDFPPWAGWLVAIGVCLVVNSLPFMFIVTYHKRTIRRELHHPS